jgi:hypothetical protein
MTFLDNIMTQSSYHNHYNKNMVLFHVGQISPFWDNHWIRIFLKNLSNKDFFLNLNLNILSGYY